MGEREIAALVADGVVERVLPDHETALRELATAELHVRSAATLAGSDPVGAFAVGYDAVRKAISAHMRASGVRVRSSAGHHRRMGLYAAAALDSAGVVEHVGLFDRFRRLRNQSEYDGLGVEARDVEELLDHARPIVAAIRKDLGR